MACVIVDYGMGNLRSIEHKLLKMGVDVRIGATPDVLAGADALILPGVGHFVEGMRNLHAQNLLPALETAVRQRRIPLLGICLGMQLLMNRSEEGDAAGLGWVPGHVQRFVFDADKRHPVPHIGWRPLQIKAPAHPLFRGVKPDQRFYFVHSYHVVCRREGDVIATAEYGAPFTAALQHKNIVGVQFHPEKSHRDGMIIFENFFRMMREGLLA